MPPAPVALGAGPSAHASFSEQSVGLLRMAGALARLGGWSVDLDDGFVRWSDEVAQIHEMPPGYSPSLEEGIAFYAPEWRARITEVFTACASEGTPYDEELELITAGGRRLWVRAVGRAVRDAAGRVIRVEGAFQDISERKQAEARLVESETRYRALFENMSAGFVLLAVVRGEGGKPVDLVIEAANRQFEATTRLEPGTYVGRRLTEVLPGIEHDAADWIGTYGRVALSGETLQFEQHSDLLGVDYLVSAFQSGVDRCAVTFVDITEGKRAERAIHELHERHAVDLERRVAERTAELEAARTRAEEADRAKSIFLATMSHELRTPLNSIVGFTDVLLSGVPGPLTPEQSKQLGIVQKASRHLLALINDILDVVQIDGGEFNVAHAPFDLRAVLTRLENPFAVEARRRGLQFDCQLPPGPAFVVADERRVEQIIQNLLSNALKFTERGSVSVSLEQVAGFHAVAVADTGIGIRADDLAKLFKPFGQLDTPSPAVREGAGLGLALSRRLAAAMGGSLSVESQWGRGSRFCLVLPTSPARTA